MESRGEGKGNGQKAIGKKWRIAVVERSRNQSNGQKVMMRLRWLSVAETKIFVFTKKYNINCALFNALQQL